MLEFPELIDSYIKLKQDTGDRAVATSSDRALLLRDQVQRAARNLFQKTDLL